MVSAPSSPTAKRKPGSPDSQPSSPPLTTSIEYVLVEVVDPDGIEIDGLAYEVLVGLPGGKLRAKLKRFSDFNCLATELVSRVLPALNEVPAQVSSQTEELLSVSSSEAPSLMTGEWLGDYLQSLLDQPELASLVAAWLFPGEGAFSSKSPDSMGAGKRRAERGVRGESTKSLNKPAQGKRPSDKEYMALFRWDPETRDDLELLPGDKVYVMQSHVDGWWYGVNLSTEKTGYFPRNYVQKCEPAPPPPGRQIGEQHRITPMVPNNIVRSNSQSRSRSPSSPRAVGETFSVGETFKVGESFPMLKMAKALWHGLSREESVASTETQLQDNTSVYALDKTDSTKSINSIPQKDMSSSKVDTHVHTHTHTIPQSHVHTHTVPPVVNENISAHTDVSSVSVQNSDIPFTLATLEAFDELVDLGVAVEIEQHTHEHTHEHIHEKESSKESPLPDSGTTGENKNTCVVSANPDSRSNHIVEGCVVHLRCEAFTWDGASLCARRYADTPGGENLCFRVGYAQVPQGLDMGVRKLKQGVRASIIAAPRLAYSDAGLPPHVPRNSHIVWKVEVLDVHVYDDEKEISTLPSGPLLMLAPSVAYRKPAHSRQSSLVVVDRETDTHTHAHTNTQSSSHVAHISAAKVIDTSALLATFAQWNAALGKGEKVDTHVPEEGKSDTRQSRNVTMSGHAEGESKGSSEKGTHVHEGSDLTIETSAEGVDVCDSSRSSTQSTKSPRAAGAVWAGIKKKFTTPF